MLLFNLSICKITKLNPNCLAVIDIPQLFYKCDPCEVLTSAVSSTPGVRELRATCLTRIISDPPLLHEAMGEGGGQSYMVISGFAGGVRVMTWDFHANLHCVLVVNCPFLTQKESQNTAEGLFASRKGNPIWMDQEQETENM